MMRLILPCSNTVGMEDNVLYSTVGSDDFPGRDSFTQKQMCRFCNSLARSLLLVLRVRAFAGWPGTWALFSWGEGPDADARKVKLITTAVGEPRTAETRDGRLGRRRVFLRDGALELICTDGSVLRVLELQPLNKNVMGAKAFINGLRGEEVTWVELEPLEVVAA